MQKMNLKKVFLSLFVILVFFVLWKNIENRVVNGCSFLNEREGDFQGQEYMITNKNVCYHKYGDELDELHKMFFGFKKVEGADPDTFIVTPQYTYGIDKNNIYLSGKKTEDDKLSHANENTFSEYVINFCNPELEGNYSRGLYHGDKAKLKKLCKILSDR